MRWDVKTKSQVVSLGPLEVSTMLMKKAAAIDERPEFEALVDTVTRYLQQQGVLVEMTPQQVAAIAFSVGYYYRVFLQKNEVRTENEYESTKSSSDTNSEEPNGSADGTTAGS